MQPYDQGPNPYAAPNPYQAPSAGYGPPQSPYGAGWATPFQKLGWKTMLSCICIGGTAIGGLLSVFVAPLADPQHPNLAIVAIVGLLSLFVGVLSLGAIVFFFMWIHAAATNLRAFGNDLLTITPGWCIGWWFIPFASMVMPFKAMSEISRASDPDARKISTTEWAMRSSNGVLKLWWAAYLMSSFFGLINGVIVYQNTIAHHHAVVAEVTPIAVIAQLFNVVAGILVIVAIRDIDRKQSDTAALLGMDGRR